MSGSYACRIEKKPAKGNDPFAGSLNAGFLRCTDEPVAEIVQAGEPILRKFDDFLPAPGPLRDTAE